MIRIVHPGSRIRILTFHPSRIPGSKRHRIPDPQHWCSSACRCAHQPAWLSDCLRPLICLTVRLSATVHTYDWKTALLPVFLSLCLSFAWLCSHRNDCLLIWPTGCSSAWGCDSCLSVGSSTWLSAYVTECLLISQIPYSITCCLLMWLFAC